MNHRKNKAKETQDRSAGPSPKSCSAESLEAADPRTSFISDTGDTGMWQAVW